MQDSNRLKRDGGNFDNLLGFLVPVNNVVIALIHLLENIGLEVFLAALLADPGRHVLHDEEMVFATAVIVDPPLFHGASAKGALGKGRHDFSPLVRGSIHFGALGI
jgi:hypothetical protein